MVVHSRIIIVLTVFLFTAPLSPANAAFNDFLKKVQSTIKPDTTVQLSSLSDETIIKGLKEALAIGAEKAVALVSKSDGYYKNPEIKIPLPPVVQQVERLLKTAGLTGLVDQFEQSMNRAAEEAAPQATQMFLDAVKEMSFTDAKKILNGRDNEATLYFKERTWEDLTQRFQPIVHKAMAEVGVTRSFQELSAKTATIPFAGPLDLDPDTYVTAKALDGLFIMLEKEELKIRQDPATRVTDILKTVFTKQP